MNRPRRGQILHDRRGPSPSAVAMPPHPSLGSNHALQEIRQYRSFRFGALPRHDDVRRRHGRHLGQHRTVAAGGRRQADRPFAGRGHQFHRYHRRLLGRPVRNHHRTGAEKPEGAAQKRGRRDQNPRRNRHQGRQFARGVALSHHRREDEPQAPATGSRRSVPDPRLRSGDADRGNAARARYARAAPATFAISACRTGPPGRS